MPRRFTSAWVSFDAKINNFGTPVSSPKNGRFREKPAERKTPGKKRVKSLSKLILDFRLAKGKCVTAFTPEDFLSAVEFREVL
jgi:hypothetical protein